VARSRMAEAVRPANLLGYALGVLFLLPVLWLVVTALTPPRGLGKFPPDLLPIPPSLTNFSRAFGENDFLGFLRNTVIVGTATTLLVLLLGIPAAYALARTAMRGRAPILIGLVTVSMFPPIGVIPPLYVAMRTIGWLNSYQALVLPYLAFNLPFAIWILRNTFREIPEGIEQAGELDGAPTWRIIVQLVVPQAIPGIFVAGIFTFVACSTEFLMALSFNTNSDVQTVPVGIALFGGQFEMPYGTIFAASAASLLPLVILVLVFGRWIVSGLSQGSMKG
jgi:trehalose/maltose transport system permease protein